jgi:uncharacterized protein (TIGR03083 family)
MVLPHRPPGARHPRACEPETLTWTLPTPAGTHPCPERNPGGNLRQVDPNPELDYLAHLATESSRFAAALVQAAPDAPVPSCPDWNADDLLWHLGEVQWFWGTVVREGLNREQAEERKPPRPDDRAGLLAFFDRSSRDLADALTAASPDSPAWTWSDDRTVGFIRRRQAHEALIHRVDAELTAGDRTPLDPVLSTDGVGEALSVMYGGLPDWGTFTPGSAGTVRLQATDTGGTWLVTLGRFTGTDPGDGNSYDEPDIHLADDDPGTQASAEVSGSAADLDCWLWHRPPLLPVQRSGDQRALSRLDATIAPGIN